VCNIRAAARREALDLRLQMRNQRVPARIARPRTTPTTMPAIVPPERAELFCELEGSEEGSPERVGRALSVLAHESSKLGGFLAGVSIVSAKPIFCTLALRKSGPGA
jgi:hypothetical protein